MEAVRTNRITSIDILRGLVMIIMALDHTRDFFHQTAMTADPLDPSTTTPALYFTRWITHFCAPVFVFLSGVSAYLSSLKKSKTEASLFLIKRGLWLMLVEVTLVTFGITFNPFFNVLILQVIWAIGCSMVLLGIFSRISAQVVLITGILLFFGHNILDLVTLPATGAAGNAWTILFRASGAIIPLGENHFLGDFYAILPWTGVMMMGYSIGHWFKKDFPAAKRKKFLLTSGSLLITLFILLRLTNVYGNPTAFKSGDGFIYNLLAFLNTNKYPPSLQYLSMTLGPACILLAVLENVHAKWSKVVSVYGSVPFFYYIFHFYLLHIILVIVFFASGHTSSEIVDPRLPFLFRPRQFGYGLGIVYTIWLSVVILLYFPCRWFSKYKKTHDQWWLRYL
jgi:uncharacterized membrane protein